MLLATVLLVVVAAVRSDASFCWYANYPNGHIVVADGNCTLADTVCATTNQCDRSNTATFSNAVLTNCTGLGQLTNYIHSSLTIKDVPSLTIEHMGLPETVTTLIFDNVTTIVDLYKTFVSHWPSVTTMSFVNGPVNFSLGVGWPQRLEHMSFANNQLSHLPPHLPDTLTTLAMRDNNLTNTSSIGSTLTSLDTSSNTLLRMTNNDFSSLKALSVSNNWDLTTIANVTFAEIAFLNMTNCWRLTNMTLDATSYAALNALHPWNRSSTIDAPTGYIINYPIATDATACNDLGGSIQKLWESTSNVSVAVCVTGTTTHHSTLQILTASAATASTTPDNYTSLVVGMACGAVFVAAAITFVYLVRQSNESPDDAIDQYRIAVDSDVRV